jgi:SAM-dependent methyltransferase
MHEAHYIGNELELFKHARNWKRYYSAFFRKHLKGDVCEVGAGLGETTRFLCDGTQNSWLCIEPDRGLSAEIEAKKLTGELPSVIEVLTGTLENLEDTRKFDAVIYIDVIEHIRDDKAELERAVARIRPGGHLVILVPAHNFLFSPFDKAIGHFRRYNKQMLRAAIPYGLRERKLIYLDSMGLFASLANKLFLKQRYPGLRQIRFWDNVIVRTSLIADRILFYRAGKSVLGIWEKK